MSNAQFGTRLVGFLDMDLSSDALPPPTSDELDGTLTPLSQLELQLDTSPSKPHLQVFVEPPMLSASAKTKYKSFQQTFFADTKVDEVIGEGFKGGTVHYFARNDGGIAYSVRLSSPSGYPTESDACFSYSSQKASSRTSGRLCWTSIVSDKAERQTISHSP